MQSMSNTMDAVTTAAGKLRDLASQQFQVLYICVYIVVKMLLFLRIISFLFCLSFMLLLHCDKLSSKDDGLPPAPNDMISSMLRYSLAMSANYRGRNANPSSVHCSIDDNRSDNGEVDLSRGDGKSEEERRNDDHGRGGYREGPSWGAHTPALTPALETISERFEDDVEMGRSPCVSESDRSQVLQAFFHGPEQMQGQMQQQQEEEEEEEVELLHRQLEYREQQQLRQAIQEELGKTEDRATLMSDVTAGTLRSERTQARSILNLRLCDIGNMGLESDRSQESQSFSYEQEQMRVQLQQQQDLQQEQREQQQQEEELLHRQQEYREQQDFRLALQAELARTEDRTSLMSDVTPGTLRTERNQARSILNLRLCDTQYM